jgi:methyltransferase OMS1
MHACCPPQGDVLEVAAGTGRNLPYYRYGDISSLTLADISPPMLEVAQAKYFDELAINFR